MRREVGQWRLAAYPNTTRVTKELLSYWFLDPERGLLLRRRQGQVRRLGKGLENLALLGAKKKPQKTLKIEIDEDAFARLYGHMSHPLPVNRVFASFA
jgi:hypothetical protein